MDRFGAHGGRVQRVSFSRAHLALPLTECDCFAKCRRRVPAEHMLSELEEHRTRERRELFSCGLHSRTQSSTVRATVVVPMDDDGRCAISMFLAVRGDLVCFPLTPRTTPARRPGPPPGGRVIGRFVSHVCLQRSLVVCG